jgi:hypothetical protein
VPPHRNNIFLRAIDHLHQGAVGEIPNVQLVFPGVSQRTAEILTVSAEVPVHPADAVDGVFIPAKALQKDSEGRTRHTPAKCYKKTVREGRGILLRGVLTGVRVAERDDLQAAVALEQHVREGALRVARSDLAEGGGGGACDGL